MRRSRPELSPGTKRTASPRTSQLLASPPPLSPPTAAEPLDWERIVGPSCCVCGEVYVPDPGGEETSGGGGGGGGNTHGPYLRRGAGAGGGGGASGEESFVVLPDSTPVLSEDYFTLARNQNHSSGAAAGGGLGVTTSSSYQVGGTNPKAGTDTTTIGYDVRLAGISGLGGGGGSSLAPGSELLESRYSSGYGGSGLGFGGGWTGSGFGVGSSSMLDSIVQISHAGLSDNVRRESLLYELSKRPARCPSSCTGGGGGIGAGRVVGRASRLHATGGRDGVGGSTAIGVGGDEGGGGGGGEEAKEEEEGEEEHDPTLCCHCYASLLEQIDEDSRLAHMEALAYRDFVGLLDGVSAERGLESSSDDTKHNNNATSLLGCSEAAEGTEDTADGAAQEKPRSRRRSTREGRDEPGDTRKENMRYRIDGNPAISSSSSSGRAQQEEEEEDDGGKDKEGGTPESSPSSPFSQALRIAQQTSVQLREELRSLERQRGGLCARGSEAWAALSELAYARGVLGEECRELLQVSREVAENAARLSERSALADLFSIRHMDGFPSINGYRLGKAPDDKRRLDWNEINAAWGEAVLLVRCVSNAVDFRSRRFRLVPLNCTSRVIELASGDNSGGLPREREEEENEGDGRLRRDPDPDPDSDPNPSSFSSSSAASAAAATSVVVVCAHDLFSTGGRGGGGGGRGPDEKHRHLAAVRAFLACSAEMISFVERRVLERRLEGEMSAGAACVAWSGVAGAPYRQTEVAVGGVSIGALKSRAAWKAWLCQLVKNLEWAVGAASSLCVA